MSEDVIPTLKRIATDYRRGSYTHTEFVDALFLKLVDRDSSEELVNQVFLLIPESALSTLQERMREMINAQNQ